ncbi:unnamed protein product [Ceratitis capitata]|uniref:(Mediterranean fruit fly) hypothetical protein n=1 Tax=Ceratitis capitata TaxID=7213 RepID=A0A811UQZ3_CERCA|nr:unnamed protein product [Ceratitis capitata]
MEEQVNSETMKFCGLLKEVYSELGFNEISVKFSDRPDIRAGSDEVWNRAERALFDAVEKTGLSYELNSGEGAFYGPKLEFILKDAIAKEVRLVDQNGNMVGVVAIEQALESAQNVDLDLVEIVPDWTPPVCKILDYSKQKYDAKKKASEAKKKQKILTIKRLS